MSKANEAFNSIRKYLKADLYERDEIIDVVLACVITGQHVFMLGPPGTAKTLLVQKLSQCFTDSKYKYNLITPTTTPSDIFGPLSLPKLEQGIRERETEGFLPDVHFSYLDELFKGNGATLQNLLSPINERKFVNGKKVMDLPLRTVFASSNETPGHESLRALYDRFGGRVFVDYIVASKNVQRMLTEPPSQLSPPSLSLSVIDQAQKEASDVIVTQEFLNSLLALRVTLQYEPEYLEVQVSDRRWKTALKIAKALAYLDGKTELKQDDLPYLLPTLWSEPEHIEQINGAILNLCSDEMQTADEKLRVAREAYRHADGTNDRMTLVNAQAELETVFESVKGARHPELRRAARAIGGMFKAIKKQIDDMDRIIEDAADEGWDELTL